MRSYLRILPLFLIYFSCQSQSDKETKGHVGGRCQGCEAIYEYGDAMLNPIDTLPKFEATEPKIKITGTVFENDGKTPAENVIVYIYHTNRDGIYEKKGDETGWGSRHGYIRGWIKTGPDGRYTFYTFRPGAYPDRTIPEHIHFVVKEPDINEYYISDIVFEDDPLLTKNERNDLSQRGGSGLVSLVKDGKLQTIKRNIVLGLNIENY